jgi:hypothetical protein
VDDLPSNGRHRQHRRDRAGAASAALLALVFGACDGGADASPNRGVDARVPLADTTPVEAPADATPRPVPSDAAAAASADSGHNPPDAANDLPDAGTAGVRIADPGPQQLDEETPFELALEVQPPGARVFALDLPPGARWDEPARTLRFTPDFTQGGDAWSVRFVARADGARAERTVTVSVADTIAPPPPEIRATQPADGWERVQLSQRTDPWLGPRGDTFDANLMRPVGLPPGARRPVRISLHGFGGRPWTEGWAGEFRIAPADPRSTYWYGYRHDGALAPYTERRVLHLLEWVLRNHPAADPERVYIEGISMGGAGAATIGLRHPRHFAWIETRIGQKIPRNHRPSRLAQLTEHWGAPDDAWDAHDLTRVLRDSPASRDAWIFTKHGKDDALIHFGAVTRPSPLTGQSWYQAIQTHRPGHLAVWDEGGHGSPDPVLPDGWWQRGWNPVFDDTAQLRRSMAFPAFSSSSADDDPGTGDGNGRVEWDAERGYAANPGTPGDTGWDGDLAGVLNRGLRWDATEMVDTIERFEVPLRVLAGDGADPPGPGYPPTGDRLSDGPPVRADVTLRRVQAFRCRPGETVGWRFGNAAGEVTADNDGAITVPGLMVESDWNTLTIRRAEGG